ncbi:dockerin type I domain-containing protein [Lachnospiraceae bacterium 48-21]
MRRYFKRAIAVLAIALMCSTLIGGGVLAENESENDFNDGVNVEETGGNEDVPEGEPGTVSGETEGEELETNIEEARSGLAGAVSPQSDDCPVNLTLKSKPTSLSEAYPVPVDLGDTFEYYVRVDNIHDNDDLTDVEVKIHVDNSLEPDVSTAKYNLTTNPSESNQHPISGSSDYTVRQEGNDIVFKANRIPVSEFVMFHITCNTKSEGIVSSKASVCSVGGVSYSGIESSSTYHNVRQEVSDFSLSTQLQSNNKWVDENHVFYYTINLLKNGKGVNLSLPYQIVNGDTVKSEGVLEFENGIGAISLPTGCAMKSSKMPTGLSYIITHRPDSNFTWQKDTMEGTTDLSGSTVQFIAGQIYNPLKYSLDTEIIVKMDGRNFKAGDSFTYAIVAENEDEYPPFNMFPLPSGDSDTIAYYENSARIKPSSGTTATLSIKENVQSYPCMVGNSCGRVYKTSAERRFWEEVACVDCGYSVQNRNVNIAPEIIFAHPGTYNYIVFQTAMESSDYDSIQQDSAQYKVTVTVSANGSNLTPSLTSVKKSSDGGKTWVGQSDKSKLTFTNVKIDGVVKGDIDKDGKVNMTDVIACLNHVAKKKILTGEALAAADVDGNGVSMTDVIKILNFVSKKTSAL